MKILLTENQLRSIAIPFFSEKIGQLPIDSTNFIENWSLLNEDDKILVLELYKILYPKRSKQLNEGFMDWVQGGLDFVGIFDPTGIADLTNAVLYFGRGETLYGMLSLVSIIPYAGDAVAKPILLGGKALGPSFKIFTDVVKTGDAVKIAKSAKSIEKLGTVGKKIVEFISAFGKDLGKVIMGLLEKGKKIPVVGKYIEVIRKWVVVFEKAAKELKLPTKTAEIGLAGGKGIMKGPEVVDLGNTLKQMMKPFGKQNSVRLFRDMVRKDRSKLLGRTKLFGRFLDSIGVTNFIGPEESLTKVPNVEQKFSDWLSTPEGQSAFNDEFGGSSDAISDTDMIRFVTRLGLGSLTPEMKNVILQFAKTQ